MNRFLSLIFLLLTYTGCHTLTVVNSDVPRSNAEVLRTEWNHTGIFGLVNYTDDFNVSYMCPDMNWSTITLERGTLAAIAEAGLTVAQNASNSSIFGVANFFWDQLSISWVCTREKNESKPSKRPQIFTSL